MKIEGYYHRIEFPFHASESRKMRLQGSLFQKVSGEACPQTPPRASDPAGLRYVAADHVKKCYG